MVVNRRVSYAQNAEDIRVWRAFRDLDPTTLTYVDVGANEPRHLSITASLYDLGWRGLLIEADPDHARQLRIHRPGDTVVECAAAADEGTLTFHRVPGTGLGTLEAAEADVAAGRGFATEQVTVPTRRIDAIWDEHLGAPAGVHFMSVDVEGAEATVLAGLDLTGHRPWVVCVEAVEPGTDTPAHQAWEPRLLEHGYMQAAFDGVNRWYVAQEHADLVEAIATPFNAIDAGRDGWVPADAAGLQERADRAYARGAWQRELILKDVAKAPRASDVEQRLHEFESALAQVTGSRAWQVAHKVTKAARIAQHKARRTVDHLPGPAKDALVRRRHLKHVRINQQHLVDPAYLDNPPPDVVDWITPDGLPPVPAGGVRVDRLDDASRAAVGAWLEAGPYDDDALLARRTDNHGDEIGRVKAALRLRLRLDDRPAPPHVAQGSKVLVDARSVQTPTFGARGIGRFAKTALVAVREAVGDANCVLLVDRAHEVLPAELAGTCEQVTRVTEADVARYSVLVQPSPMTAGADPLVPILHSTAHKIAIVFDFIPAHYSTIYLRHPAARAEYAAALDALRCYDDFVGISHLAVRELRKYLDKELAAGKQIETSVAWPADVLPAGIDVPPSRGTGPIVVMTGDEPRKNTYGALAAIGAATAGDASREVIVIGMAGHGTRVHHWSIAAAMRPGEAVTLGRVSDAEMHATLANASAVVVASFDEGLSLPVIEALVNGAPVVASDIPAHRELIGTGSFLAPAGDIKALAQAIRTHSGRASTQQQQLRKLKQHEHESLEAVLATKVGAHRQANEVSLPPRVIDLEGRSLRLGFATPWESQRSGVADFSAATVRELAELADVTVYTTSGGKVEDGIAHGHIDEVLQYGSDHDVFVTVVGNSHFHIPFIEVMGKVDAVAIAHDTRMVEYYMAMRSKGGVEQVMLRGQQQRHLAPSLDDQIDDMRLLQNAGFWEIAHQAKMLILHAPSAASRIEAETGVTPRLLPFANQRVPRTPELTEQMRSQARARLGLDPSRVHIASFGYVDLRTKLTDVVVESAAWLAQWGHPVSLHLAGAASEQQVAELTKRAQEAGIGEFEITGFLTDEQFRDYLLAVDLGLQLRVSPLLGVSGPLSDLAAFGTTTVASNGLAVDVDTPDYVDRLPDEVSPLMVAEALEQRIADPIPHEVLEEQRRAYLDRKSPKRYAQALLDLLEEAGPS